MKCPTSDLSLRDKFYAMTAPAVENSLIRFAANPYMVYQRFQKLGFPFWLPNANNATGGTWLFTRYDDVVAILKEARISKDVSRLIPTERVTPINHAMLSKDPPDHTRLRTLVSMAFTPTRIKDLELRIEQVAESLIDEMLAQREINFMEAFALPLPVIIIAELLGVPMSDRAVFREWSNQVINGGDAARFNRDITLGQHEALVALSDYFAKLIHARRKHPQADLISDLIQVRDSQSRLTEHELIGTCILLLIAGHETSANLLGNGMLTLLRFPDQLQLLRDHPEHMPTAIEEMLRYESPLQQATFRVTGETFTFDAVTLQQGQHISALIGAANRDAKYFENPDVFDITRTPNRHIAFGFGVHFCLGASLARTEGRIGFSKLLERVPHLQLLDEHPAWNSNSCLRGLQSLWVKV